MTAAPTRTAGAAPRRTLARELVTPRALGLLALALLAAAVFGALGQWQLQRAVQNGAVAPRTTERVLPLTAVARPGALQHDSSIGQLVTVRGRYAAGDHLVVSDRLNGGRMGVWVTAHLLTVDGGQLAVALGWTQTEATARAVARRLDAEPQGTLTVLGRYIDSDAAEAPVNGGVGRLTAMSVPVLLNEWRTAAARPTYVGYVTLRHAPAGLTTIDSPPPSVERTLNLLNLLYAGEWTVFGLLALYVWYRVVRDRWEVAGAVDSEGADAGDAERELVPASSAPGALDDRA